MGRRNKNYSVYESEDYIMIKKVKKISAVLLTMLLAVAAPSNVFAMTGTENAIAVYNYGQSGSCTRSYTGFVQMDGVTQAIVGVKVDVSLYYEWDEGYASRFTDGRGSASVTQIPDIYDKEGWSADVNVARITGSNIVFNVTVKRHGSTVGSFEIAYNVDEYGQVS